MLSLPEELLLLAIHDEKGTVVTSASIALNYGLLGAILMELALEGYIETRDKKITIKKRNYRGNDIYNEVFKHIKGAPKGKDAKYWINRLNMKIKKLRERMLDQLVDKKILRKDEKTVLWIFPSKKYPTKNAEPELEIRTRIRKVVLHGNKPDERTAILITLINSCSLVNEIFSREERKEAKKKIKEIMKSDVITKAVTDSVAAVQTAIITGVATSIGTSAAISNR